MKEGLEENELFRASHIMILKSYTIFSVVLISEALILGWERWALALVAMALAFSWYLHLQDKLTPHSRLWIYSLFMMATYFFYGIHLTSTYDLAIVMAAVILLYIMTGIEALVTLCQSTFYFTFIIDINILAHKGVVFDTLTITRSLLHIGMVTMISWIGRTIIAKWSEVINRTQMDISDLEEITTRLNDFLVNLSHEIRTPINVILGLSKVCFDREKNPEIKKDLKSVQEAGRFVEAQIGEVLEYSEIDRGRLVNNLNPYSLTALLNEIKGTVLPAVSEKVEFIMDVDPDLPTHLYSDEDKVRKIIWHLVYNAVKFTDKGSVHVKVSSFKKEYGIDLFVEVADTGIGMNEEQLDQIYTRFYQGDSGRTRNVNGLGLGMSIVHGFVESLGGSVDVKSVEGKGTTAVVILPQKVVDETDHTEREPQEKDNDNRIIRLKDVRALVVDDEPLNLIVAEGLLKRYGMIISTAGSGQESIELCSSNDYDIVFMDHMMPEMEGIEAMKRIRDQQRTMNKPQIPVIALTANTASEARETFLKEGFDGFVAKPIEAAELEKVLKRVMPEGAIEYVETEEATEKEGFRIEGIDTGVGLRYSRDDMEFYTTILSRFATENSDKTARMDQAVATGDAKSFELVTHSLKSMSKMIGAKKLSEMAREMELAAEKGSLPSQDSYRELIKLYGDITANISKALNLDLSASDVQEEEEEILVFEPSGEDS